MNGTADRRCGLPTTVFTVAAVFSTVLLLSFDRAAGREAAGHKKETPVPLVPPLLSGSEKQTKKKNAPPRFVKIREAAAAGVFYPSDKKELSKLLDRFLDAAHPPAVPGKVRALICPHAGYRCSGPVAAYSYKLLRGRRDVRTVVVLGPSHYAAFAGASVTDADAYRTPLGLIPVSPTAKKIAAVPPFVRNPPCRVAPPSWARYSLKPPPPPGKSTPHTWEHSLEVELPFLQKTLRDFALVPVVCGRVDPAAAARVLAKFLDDRSLLVVSSDLSHYYPYEKARRLDAAFLKSVCALDLDAAAKGEACGKTPILILLHLAKQKGWKAKLLDRRNSGDTTGDKSAVVGYGAVAFYEPAGKTAAPKETSAKKAGERATVKKEAGSLSARERRFLLQLARAAVTAAAAGHRPPPVKESELTEKLKKPRGCFVTLTKAGRLRGCIGHLRPYEQLYLAVRDNARNAALRDPRFPPVRPEEAASLHLEISLPTVPRRLKFSDPEDLLNKLRPRRDGVVLSLGRQGATYLPQVWKLLPKKEEFLSHLSRKAGLPPTIWREKGVRIETYRVEAFEEERPATGVRNEKQNTGKEKSKP